MVLNTLAAMLRVRSLHSNESQTKMPAGSVAHLAADHQTEATADKSVATPSSAKSSKTVRNSITLDFAQLPKKYRRRPLTQDEIDLVAVSALASSMMMNIRS